ncbi:MAG: sialate O-acetylesterase [Myxococcota bacterium]|nr:sialate O-acetylesterase [Myxococcota bacterium]
MTAGQSNSANHGSPAQRVQDERVLAHDLVSSWHPAHDPQPIATGSGGSPWPLLGELLVARLEVPVGFVSVGWGGTSIAQWQPGGTLYPRLQGALQFLGPQGCRAVLWHQGESDNIADTSTASYAAQLQTLIAQSRVDAGFALPWGVALVSFLSGYGVDPAVVAGQQQVIDQDPLTFLGPNTDELDATTYRFDGAHFNALGLQEHARRWAEALVPLLGVCNDGLCDVGESCASCPGDCGDCCGDGLCDGSLFESPLSCASDCPALCGDGWCSHAEGCADCPGDCGDCPVDEEELEAEEEADVAPELEVDAELDAETELSEDSESPPEAVDISDFEGELPPPQDEPEELGELVPSADVEPPEQVDEALVGSGELQRAEGGCACQSSRPLKGSWLWLMGLACLMAVGLARRHSPGDRSHR